MGEAIRTISTCVLTLKWKPGRHVLGTPGVRMLRVMLRKDPVSYMIGKCIKAGTLGAFNVLTHRGPVGEAPLYEAFATVNCFFLPKATAYGR